MKTLAAVLVALVMFALPVVGAESTAVTPKPDATFCFVPYEGCAGGGCDLQEYVGASFTGWDAALNFFQHGITRDQQDTARFVVFAQFGRHVVLLYRTARFQKHADDPVTSCPSREVIVREFASIEQAAVELNQLPLSTRSGAAILAVPPSPSVPTAALLVYLGLPK